MSEAVMHELEFQTPTNISAGGRARAASRSVQSVQRTCTNCEKESVKQPMMAKKEEEETPGSMRPGLGGKCDRYFGTQVNRRVINGYGATKGKIQRQPLTKRGNIGCPVPELQEALNATGEALVVDGIFGPSTQAAVRRFQTAHHPPLAIDGEVGTNTWPVLHTAAPGDHGLPAGETTTSNGWAAGGLHRWRQRLTPFTTHFGSATAGRCQVREADGGGGADTCHFPGSAFAPFTAITGGTWDVDGTNRWGDDFVGWFAPAVTFYRANGRAPCSATFTQSMRVVRPSGDVEYRRNVLRSDIGLTTVSSTRDGHTETRPFP
jgi:peptidoglycan hydrolase-like protein with peptidoglycan-binding domain